MAQRFDLTAQLQLQAPTNTRQVVNQIRQQLQGVSVNVDVQANARAVQQVNRSLQNTSRQANSASRSIGTLNKNLSEAARRFGVITLATGTMLSFAQSVKKAVREAVEFERELVKISQVTGKSVQELSSLTSEITRLSTSLGVSSSKLLETSRVLAQAGFSADETRKALDILAKTTLGSSFDDITKTVEGSIAVLRQFRAEALATGGEIKFLEQTLDAINSVSKSFAVESSDLIAVIQRVGGVFASAGGSVNELIALFTSVRATTRESAETIATGLRTIFTRIQRTDTVNQLEQLGISLRDAQGRFVGAYEAVRRLSLGLSALDPRDYRFSEIVEELGGFRQIGKVIPLIQQFTIAQDALNVAQSASGSVAEDALTAQQSLAVQVQKVKEEFAALIRQFADSSTFRSIASAALQLASALIKIGEALEPVLPLLTSLLALKIGQGLAPGLGALLGFGGRRRYGGGVIRKFASGGFVPGTGNSDSVPAMLQPGEFVIRKSSAQKLGAETLLAMNQNKYANGVKIAKSGNVTKKDISAASNSELEDVLNNKNLSVASRLGIESELGRRRNKPKIATLKEGIVGGLFLQEGEGGKRGISKDLKGIQLQSNFPRVDRIEGNIYTGLLKKRASNEIRSQLEPNIINAVQSAASNTIKTFEIAPLGIDESQAAKSAVQKVDTTAIEGYIFEAFISAISGAQLSEAGATFDYVNPSSSAKGRLKNIFGPDPVVGRLLDAKRTLNSDTVQSGKSSIANKIVAGINSGLLSREDFILRNKGGGVGTDTVPALLTPGEFVINKSAAQSIGYTNLSNMNKTGVAKFAKGGAVGVQKFANGGLAGPAGNITAFMNISVLDQTAERLAVALNARIAQEQKRIQQTNQNISADQALNLATLKVNVQYKNLEQDTVELVKTIRDLEKEGKKVQRSSSKYYQALDAAGQSLKPGRAVAQAANQLRDPGVRQQAIGKIDQIAGAAQQFVFLGSAAAALASQFGGLSEVQEKAVTETAAFVTSIVGIGGTIVQLFTSLLASTGASAAANAAEAVASGVAASGDAVEAVGSGVAAVADTAEAGATALATIAVTSFAVAIGAAIVIVLAIAAAFKYAAAKARAEADELSKAAQDQLKSIQELTGSTNEFVRLQKEMVEKQKEAAQNDAGTIGALIGGLLGAAIGAILGPIGIVIGASIGAWVGGVTAASQEAARQAEITRRFNGELELSARLLAETTQAQAEFKQALSDIDLEENLSPEDRVGRRLGAQAGMGRINSRSVAEANRQLGRLADELGKPISELREEDFDNPELLAIFQNAQQNLANGLNGFVSALAESRKTLAEAAAIEITGDKTFDELIANNGLFAQALRASQQAIRDEAKARIDSLNTQLATETDPAKQQQLQEKIDQAREREARQLKDQEDGYRSMAEEAKKNADAIRDATLAQEAYRKSLMKIMQFEKALLMAENALTRLDQSISNIGAIISGGDFDFSRIAPAGIEDISQVYDRAGFNAGIDQLANGLGAGGRRIAEKVKETSAFIARAQQQLIGKTFDDKGEGIDTKQILTDLGLDVTKLTKEQLSAIDTQLREAAKDGIISEDEFNEIFAPIMEEGQRGADALKKANDIRNKELKSYQDFLGVLETQRQKEIEARQKVVETQAKGQELMAKARGEELSLAQKEAARTASAQIPLNRFGLQAGDAAGANRVRNQAQARLATIQGEIAAGRGTPALIKEQKELSAAVNATTNELNRLSDQSEKAADIMAEIEKERQKRQSLKDITEDFVVGGNEQRQQINEAFAGIQQAVASGTLQMQSEDQRRATVQMLDRLKDVQIPGAGGLTGSQVKEQLIMQDAMRLGMDPEVAKAIYGATTKEEQLIQSMDNLAAQQNQAAQMNAAFEAQNTAMLINSEQQLIQALNNLANNIGAALMSSGGQVPRYLSKGGVGSLFRPKGTDTIPAMLTPGEYVLQKKIVDRYGVNAIEALNNGSAEIAYLAGGGSSRLRGRGGRKPSTGVGIFGAGETVMASRDGDNNIGGGRRLSSRGSRPQSGGIGGGGVGRGGAGTVPNLSGPREQVQAEKEGKFAPFPYERKAPTNVVDYNYTKGDGSDFTAAIGSDEARSYDPFAEVKANTSVVQPVDRSQYALPIRQMGTENERRQIQARRIASESIRRRREEKQNRYAQIMARRRGGFNQMMTPNQNIGVGTGSYMANNFGGGRYAGGGGGMMSIDSGGVQTVFDNFIGNFSGVFDNIVKSFSGLQNSLTQLAQSMSGFTMQHNVTVEGLVSIGGINIESIKQELSTHIGQMVGQEVSRVMNENSKRFKAG